jgi:hypothetical protein
VDVHSLTKDHVIGLKVHVKHVSVTPNAMAASSEPLDDLEGLDRKWKYACPQTRIRHQQTHSDKSSWCGREVASSDNDVKSKIETAETLGVGRDMASWIRRRGRVPGLVNLRPGF